MCSGTCYLNLFLGRAILISVINKRDSSFIYGWYTRPWCIKKYDNLNHFLLSTPTFLGRRIFGPQMSKNTYPQITIGIENPITIITKMMIKFTSIMVFNYIQSSIPSPTNCHITLILLWTSCFHRVSWDLYKCILIWNHIRESELSSVNAVTVRDIAPTVISRLSILSVLRTVCPCSFVYTFPSALELASYIFQTGGSGSGTGQVSWRPIV